MYFYLSIADSSSSSDSESESEVEQVEVTTTKKPTSKAASKSPTKPASKGKRKQESSDDEGSDSDSGSSSAKKSKTSEAPYVPSGPITITPAKDLNIQGEAENLVYRYLLEQNRPFLAQQVSENMHGAVKKTAAAAVLENLVEQGAVVGKLFGKSKIYHVNQVCYIY